MKQEINRYILELYPLADEVDGPETDILDARKFIEAQSTDPESCQAVTSVGKPTSTIT